MQKHFARFVTVLLMVAVLGAAALPAMAQDDPICNGLSADDCTILTDARGMMDGVSSFSTPAWSINADLTADDQSGMFEANGSGGFGFDKSAASPLDGLTLYLNIEKAMLDTPDANESGSMQIILKDSMLYLNVEGQWYGGPLDEADMELPPNMDDANGLSQDEVALSMGSALTTVREADEELAGQTMAVFTTTIDLPQAAIAMLKVVLENGLLDELGGMDSGMELGEISPEDMDMLSLMLTPFLAQSSLTVQQWVGLDDGLVHRVGIDAVVDVDLSQLSSDGGTLMGQFHFSSDVDQLGEPVDAPIPDEYAPLDELGMSSSSLDA